ncbi:hypothetical protein N7454_008259 [Penicillium verhagenii]|nr:hypothetical protein N7454_008259 [Penicillium verhagenii]
MSSPPKVPKTPSKRAAPAKGSAKSPRDARDGDVVEMKALVNVLKSFDKAEKKVKPSRRSSTSDELLTDDFAAIQIDLNVFATLQGYTNVRSASNTFHKLRKAHGLNVESFTIRPKASPTKVTKSSGKTRAAKKTKEVSSGGAIPSADGTNMSSGGVVSAADAMDLSSDSVELSSEEENDLAKEPVGDEQGDEDALMESPLKKFEKEEVPAKDLLSAMNLYVQGEL